MPLSSSLSAPALIALATGSGLAAASLAHCALMCGPLALASHVRAGRGASRAYFVGRLVSYTLLGAIAGSAGRVLLHSAWARWTEAMLSWSLAALLLFSALRLLRERRSQEPLIRLGARPRSSWVGRALAHVAGDPLLLGVATALLPCGALFAALAAAAAQGGPALGALSMASFAAITGLAVVGVGRFSMLRAHGPGVRRATGVALVVGAAVMASRPLPLLRAKEGAVPACHAHSGAEETAR